MERNDNFGSTGGFDENTGSTGGSLGGTGGYGNTGGNTGSAGYGAGAGGSGLGDSSFGAGGANYASTNTQGGYGASDLGSAGTADRGRMDQAKDKLGQAREAVGSGLGTVKEKASNLSATLADKLEAGAEKLRQRQQGGANMAYAGGATAASDDRMSAVNNQLAGGLQGAADWLRDGDLRATVEQQVRENPGRTLLIALGVGYLLGKAFRK